jgi:dolichyl-phosphate beta-glucosyltransferase
VIEPPETELSLVLPAYRGADLVRKHVPPLLVYIDRLDIDYEIIIADDGSGDGGATERAAADLGCRYVANPKNQGKGAAVRRGMRASRGRFRMYTDVDIPYEYAAIEAMLDYLSRKQFHMVAGDRTLDESSYAAHVSIVRRLASMVCTRVVGQIVTTGWYDTQCGLKGFRALVAEDLFGVSRINRFAFDVELFYIALKRNYDIKRLPVTLRCNETSTVNVLTDGAALVRDLGVIRWNQALGRYRPTVPVLRHVEDDSQVTWPFRTWQRRS